MKKTFFFIAFFAVLFMIWEGTSLYFNNLVSFSHLLRKY